MGPKGSILCSDVPTSCLVPNSDQVALKLKRELWNEPLRLPDGLSELDAMSIGTAGLTSMLAMQAIEDQGVGSAPILVTGAAGGVGSVACWACLDHR